MEENLAWPVAGTNCCYVEQLSNIGKFHINFRHLSRTSDTVVNTVRQDCSAATVCQQGLALSEGQMS